MTGTTGTALDVVVPSGSRSISTGTITFGGGYRPITYSSCVVPVVRAPFTNADQSFAHRVIRDLYLRHTTDLGGRSDWIGRLRDGLVTRRPTGRLNPEPGHHVVAPTTTW